MNREALTCPECGSPDLQKVSWSERRCQHCGVLSVLSPGRQLLLLEWQCPHCGFNNEKGWKRCGQCGTPLVKACPSCRAEMRWDLTHCPQCGQPYSRGEPRNECPACGAVQAPDEIYCQACAHQISGSRQCPHCGESIPVPARFCTRCGHAA